MKTLQILWIVVGLLVVIGSPAVAQQDDLYAPYTIDALASRSYGGGSIQAHQILAETANFTRYLISYPSDGLTIYGFLNVPNGTVSSSVVIAIHGYVNPSAYNTLDYTTRYADALANAGYLVIHPNLRGHAPSDSGEDDDNLYRIGYAVDVLNLIAIVQEQAGTPGVLETANGDAIGLWGHSMGGGISVRVMTVNPDVKAVVLYGSMSGNEKDNAERIIDWSGGASGQTEFETPDVELVRISPIYHLQRVQAAVSIHHGANDTQVPPEWSDDLCTELQTLGKTVECFTYDGQPHTFSGNGDQLFIERMIAFYDTFLG